MPGRGRAAGRPLLGSFDKSLAKLDLKEKKIGMPEFMRITKQSIRDMRQAVRCLEDFDLFYVAAANMPSTQSPADNGS